MFLEYNGNMEEEKKELEEVSDIEEYHPSEKAAKIIAIVIFSLIMAALVGAIVADIVIFGQQILAFVLACFASAMIFLVAIILMVISCIFIFGVYLLESEGFWPVAWATQVYKDVMSDAQVTLDQINAFLVVRILIVALCLAVFIASIIALSMRKQVRKEFPERTQKLTNAFSIVSLILSIFGALAGGIMIFLVRLFSA